MMTTAVYKENSMFMSIAISSGLSVISLKCIIFLVTRKYPFIGTLLSPYVVFIEFYLRLTNRIAAPNENQKYFIQKNALTMHTMQYMFWMDSHVELRHWCLIYMVIFQTNQVVVSICVRMSILPYICIQCTQRINIRYDWIPCRTILHTDSSTFFHNSQSSTNFRHKLNAFTTRMNHRIQIDTGFCMFQVICCILRLLMLTTMTVMMWTTAWINYPTLFSLHRDTFIIHYFAIYVLQLPSPFIVHQIRL